MSSANKFPGYEIGWKIDVMFYWRSIKNCIEEIPQF
jgi:hypothetical protein